jgi:hypothetical protein
VNTLVMEPISKMRSCHETSVSIGPDPTVLHWPPT